MSPPARLLEWDGEHFGVRVARVETPRLSAADATALRAWMEAERIACAYFLAEADDAESVRAAQAAGFRLTDVRVTFERPLTGFDPRPEPGVEPAGASDVPTLRAIAETSHRDGRFHHDGRFERARCDALYGRWIERSVDGWADAVLVPRAADRRPLGYVTCHLDDDGAARIGLIAVAEAARGAGLGARLVRAALAWSAARGASGARVVTQARNVPALRLYEGHGYRARRVQLWFHLWPAPDPRGRP